MFCGRGLMLAVLPGLAAGILAPPGNGTNQLRKAEGRSGAVRTGVVRGAEDRTAKGAAEEKDVYEAQASYEYPHYYHGDGYGYGYHHHHVSHVNDDAVKGLLIPLAGIALLGAAHIGDGYGYGYHHHHVSHVNDDAVKGLLIPLAGIALLGAAAIAASNPVLLQIGVVGGSIGKRRRRRAIPRIEDLKVLEKFLEQIPKPQVISQEKKLQASYFQCSGIGNQVNRCFERVTCEIGRPGNGTLFEKQVLDIVISDVMSNEYLPNEMKYRIHEAQKIGYHRGDCSRYHCKEIETTYA